MFLEQKARPGMNFESKMDARDVVWSKRIGRDELWAQKARPGGAAGATGRSCRGKTMIFTLSFEQYSFNGICMEFLLIFMGTWSQVFHKESLYIH